MDDGATELIPTRKSLLGRLRSWEDQASWHEFFDAYWKLIYGVARKAGLDHTEAQDVVQDTVLAVAKSIGHFRYEPAVCSFKSWLMRVTRSKIANQFNRRHKHSQSWDDTEDATPALESLPDLRVADLETIWDAEWEKNLVEAAVERIKGLVRIEQFQIFDFYVLKRWPVRKVARTLGVSMAQVYVVKHRIGRLVRREVERLEQTPL